MEPPPPSNGSGGKDDHGHTPKVPPPNPVKGPGSSRSGSGGGATGGGEGQPSKDVTVTLDEDLRRKVQSLKIGDGPKEEDEGRKEEEGDTAKKTYEDWKDELPIHIKSLKFMIDVLNDKHTKTVPVDFDFAAVATNCAMASVASNKMNNNNNNNDSEASDQVFPLPGDFKRTRNSGSSFLHKKTLSHFHQPSSLPFGSHCPRMDARHFPRRRTKSAEPDLSSYRNETLFGTRSFKHRDSEGGISTCSNVSDWFRKRRSVELNGVYVVEEINEDENEEDEELALLGRGKRITSADGSPDSFLSVEMELGGGGSSDSSSSSPLKPVHRMRRDLWNISPINEDFLETENKDPALINTNIESVTSMENGNGNGNESIASLEENMTISSTNATFGDEEALCVSSVINSRLSCSSPILSQSPSLKGYGSLNNSLSMNTPTTPVASTTPRSTSGGRSARQNKGIRARNLEDIPDKEEDSVVHPQQNEVVEAKSPSSPDEEEKTESFDIELDVCDENDDSCEVSPHLLRDLNLDKSFEEAKEEDATECKIDNNDTKDQCQPPKQEAASSASNSVWDTLSANIQAHIGVGNPAGFVSGPCSSPPSSPRQQK